MGENHKIPSTIPSITSNTFNSTQDIDWVKINKKINTMDNLNNLIGPVYWLITDIVVIEFKIYSSPVFIARRELG